MFTKIIIGFILFVIAISAFWFIWLRYYIYRGHQVVERSTKFERSIENSKQQILIIGDSVAYGVGATDATLSLAGRLSSRYPNASIKNLGKNGMKVAELNKKLQSIDKTYDYLQIHIGGNDVIRFSNYNEVEENLRQALEKTKSLSDDVILLSSGDIGSAFLFPPGSRWIMHKRTLKIREIFLRVSAEFDHVTYIDLFREKEEDPYYLEPDIYYAEDFLHPSNEGYGLWWSLIEPELDKLEI